MNRMEFKESNEYKEMIEKIKSYSKGFRFNIPYYKMTTGQKNAMYIVIDGNEYSCLILPVSVGFNNGYKDIESFRKQLDRAA